jgi:hypothetical protein
MKTSYIYLGLIAILMWNGFIIQRDQKLFEAYDACTKFTHHPDCPYDKK